MGNKKERQKCHWFDFSRHQALFVTHKKQCLLLVGVKGMLWGAYVAACTAQRQQKDSNPFLWTVIQSVFWKIGRNSEEGFEKKEEKKHTHTHNYTQAQIE